MARAYIAIASGSPCVVPSREVMYSPPMNNLAGLQLVLVRMGAIRLDIEHGHSGGQPLC